ncbi:MAG: Tfp pilus assembly protein FimT/FimU [Candidatus Paceibacteria bacterium]
MVTHKKNTSLQGFGLVELIVSLSIVTIVTSIVIARHNAFNGAILLRNQAYEIAFVIQRAQQLAVSGQTTALTTTIRQRYGVAFSTGTTGAVNRQVIVLYKDNNNNGVLDDADDVIETIRLDSRFRIGTMTIADTSRGSVRVLFERPLFDAKFYQGTSNSLQTGPVRITVRPVSGSTAERVIVVSSAGQVTVE